MGLVGGTPTRFETQKSEKALPRQQLLLDTSQNRITSRCFCGYHVLKVWWKSLHGFSLWNTHKVYARGRHPDGAGYDYGVKNCQIS